MSIRQNLPATILLEVYSLEFKVCLHHSRNDRGGYGSAFTAVVCECQDYDLRVVERRVCKSPRMFGPGTILTAVGDPRHIITVFGSTCLAGNGDWERIILRKYLVQGPKRIGSNRHPGSSPYNFDGGWLNNFLVPGWVTISLFTAPLSNKRSFGNIPFHIGSKR